MTKGIYYIGRVLKLQLLDQEKLFKALKEPVVISDRANNWTFIDIEEYNQSGHHFIYGKLSKFSPDGEVTIIDPKARSEKTQVEPNLRIASSPFVYIPEHSGIAFLQVYGHIEQKMFIRKFCEIIESTHDNFFVECDIDLIADLRTFASKLSSLDQIFKISAKISPPNPLFSPLWEELEKYLRERNTDKMTIIEDASQAQPLQSSLPELVQKASEQTEEMQFCPDVKIPIGDAAILMAADGYGSGAVCGKKDNEVIVIKTSETALSFEHPRDSDAYSLYQKSFDILEEIKGSRHMEHGK